LKSDFSQQTINLRETQYQHHSKPLRSPQTSQNSPRW
jgi:hypothetical protein